jgi:hypothetical protein
MEMTMPEKTNTKIAKPAVEFADVQTGYQPIDQLVKVLRKTDGAIEVPPAAREFVKKSAVTAKQRAASAHNGALQLTGAFENVLTRTVSGSAEISRGLLQAAHQNVEATFAVVEKLATVSCFEEASRVYVEFLRERARVGVAQAKDAAESLRHNLTEGAKAIQNEVAKVTAAAKAA